MATVNMWGKAPPNFQDYNQESGRLHGLFGGLVDAEGFGGEVVVG